MGRVISGKYEELEQLGQEGKGAVYKVRHTEHKTTLVLKTIPPSFLGNLITIERFEQEVLTLKRLQHRNIAQTLESGRDEERGLIYIVTEYIQGKTLKQYLQEKGFLSLPEVLDISRQIGLALAYAHSQTPAVVHRDIKPSNIMIEDFSGRALLLDFSIAKKLVEGREPQAPSGSIVGTWKYSSPEQLRHEPLTGSSDVYSLGMVLYEMYTGKQFFAGLDEPTVLSRVLNDEREHEPYFVNPPIPEFVALIKKAIAKPQNKRYRRMADLLNELEACWWALDESRTVVLSGVVLTRPTPLKESSPINTTPKQEPETSKSATAEQVRGQSEGQKLKTLDVEIQLKREQQRSAVVSLQTKVQETREEAERAGAKQWAEELFEQGRGYEERASIYLRDEQYQLTQEAFESARGLFIQATEATEKARLRSQAEQARRAVETTKEEADRYGAQEKVQTGYDQALALFVRAEVEFKQEAYDDACKLYAEARNQFEDTRDLARHESRREETRMAQAETAAVRDAVLGARATGLVTTLIKEAENSEQHAAEAFAREDFTRAQALYKEASQKYAQAQHQAQIEHLQRKVHQAAHLTAVAHQQAINMVGKTEPPPAYRQALDGQKRAAAYREAQEYVKALQEYEQAQQGYEKAAEVLSVALQERAKEFTPQASHALAQKNFSNVQQLRKKEDSPRIVSPPIGDDQTVRIPLPRSVPSTYKVGPANFSRDIPRGKNRPTEGAAVRELPLLPPAASKGNLSNAPTGRLSPPSSVVTRKATRQKPPFRTYALIGTALLVIVIGIFFVIRELSIPEPEQPSSVKIRNEKPALDKGRALSEGGEP